MKTKALLLIAALVVVAALIYGYRRMSAERAQEAKGEQPITAASSVERSASGETFIKLTADTQKLLGLQTAPPAAVTLDRELPAYGRVLDPAPLVGLVSGIGAARAALEASNKEYQRLQTLFAQGQSASAKAVEAAEAEVKRDRILLQAAEAQLVAAWGEPLATQPDLAGFVQSLIRLETALVRLDLPTGESLNETPKGARLLPVGIGQPITARFLGRATRTDLQTQGQGFLFVATNAPAMLTPGLALKGFLQLPGEPLAGVIVPAAAVVRSAERAWVYAQTGDTAFARREIALDHPVADGWFVTHGVAATDRLVVTGAQALLSEERKTQIQVGD